MFFTKFSNCVVCDEPVVDVEHDKEGGEAGDGEDIENARVVDHKSDSVLAMMTMMTMMTMMMMMTTLALRKIANYVGNESWVIDITVKEGA